MAQIVPSTAQKQALYGPVDPGTGHIRHSTVPYPPCHARYGRYATMALLYRTVPCPVLSMLPCYATLDRLVDSGSLVLLVRWIGPTACRVAPARALPDGGVVHRDKGNPRELALVESPSALVRYWSMSNPRDRALVGLSTEALFSPLFWVIFEVPVEGACGGCHFCDEKWVKKGPPSMRFFVNNFLE